MFEFTAGDLKANKQQNAALSSVSGNVRFDRDHPAESGITSYIVTDGKKKSRFADGMSETFKKTKNTGCLIPKRGCMSLPFRMSHSNE